MVSLEGLALLMSGAHQSMQARQQSADEGWDAQLQSAIYQEWLGGRTLTNGGGGAETSAATPRHSVLPGPSLPLAGHWLQAPALAAPAHWPEPAVTRPAPLEQDEVALAAEGVPMPTLSRPQIVALNTAGTEPVTAEESSPRGGRLVRPDAPGPIDELPTAAPDEGVAEHTPAALPVRVHVQQHAERADVWLGVDQDWLTHAPHILAGVQQRLTEQGIALRAVVVNGRPITRSATPDMAAGHPFYLSESEHKDEQP